MINLATQYTTFVIGVYSPLHRPLTKEDLKMAKKQSDTIRIFTLAGILGLAVVLLAACGGGDGTSVSPNGSGTVMLYNYDNHDYRVELRQTLDDQVLGILTIRDYNPLQNNWIDSFEDVPDGIYYLIISRNGSPVSRSGDFTIEVDETVCYQIEEDASISGC
jgi:hypothetical protein